MRLFESLERRCLLSDSPPSMAGLEISFNIEEGTAPFAPSGSFDVNTSTSVASYALDGKTNVADSSGTYTYAKNGVDTASIQFNDASLGAISASVTFLAAKTGTYRFDAAGGFQTGVFTIRDPIDLGSVSNGVLTI